MLCESMLAKLSSSILWKLSFNETYLLSTFLESFQLDTSQVFNYKKILFKKALLEYQFTTIIVIMTKMMY